MMVGFEWFREKKRVHEEVYDYVMADEKWFEVSDVLDNSMLRSWQDSGLAQVLILPSFFLSCKPFSAGGIPGRLDSLADGEERNQPSSTNQTLDCDGRLRKSSTIYSLGLCPLLGALHTLPPCFALCRLALLVGG